MWFKFECLLEKALEAKAGAASRGIKKRVKIMIGPSIDKMN